MPKLSIRCSFLTPLPCPTLMQHIPCAVAATPMRTKKTILLVAFADADNDSCSCSHVGISINILVLGSTALPVAAAAPVAASSSHLRPEGCIEGFAAWDESLRRQIRRRMMMMRAFVGRRYLFYSSCEENESFPMYPKPGTIRRAVEQQPKQNSSKLLNRKGATTTSPPLHPKVKKKKTRSRHENMHFNTLYPLSPHFLFSLYTVRRFPPLPPLSSPPTPLSLPVAPTSQTTSH